MFIIYVQGMVSFEWSIMYGTYIHGYFVNHLMLFLWFRWACSSSTSRWLFIEEIVGSRKQRSWNCQQCPVPEGVGGGIVLVMWRFLGSRFTLRQSKVLFEDAKRHWTRLFSIRSTNKGGYLRYYLGSLAFTGVTLGTWTWGSHSFSQMWKEAACEELLFSETQDKEDNITLYQFASCPYCNKVRAFLDYYGMNYTIVEVDPLFKKELKFSEYRKVPVVIIRGIQVSVNREK